MVRGHGLVDDPTVTAKLHHLIFEDELPNRVRVWQPAAAEDEVAEVSTRLGAARRQSIVDLVLSGPLSQREPLPDGVEQDGTELLWQGEEFVAVKDDGARAESAERNR